MDKLHLQNIDNKSHKAPHGMYRKNYIYIHVYILYIYNSSGNSKFVTYCKIVTLYSCPLQLIPHFIFPLHTSSIRVLALAKVGGMLPHKTQALLNNIALLGTGKHSVTELSRNEVCQWASTLMCPVRIQQDSNSLCPHTVSIISLGLKLSPSGHLLQLYRASYFWVCPDIFKLLASVTVTPDEAGWREALPRTWDVAMEIMFSHLAV